MKKIYLLSFFLFTLNLIGQGLPPFVRNQYDTNDPAAATAAVRSVAQTAISTNQITLTGVVTGVGSNTITVTFSTAGNDAIKSVVGGMNLLTNSGAIKIAGSSLSVSSGTASFVMGANPVNFGTALQIANNGSSIDITGGIRIDGTGIHLRTTALDGNINGATNASPAVATNYAAATDGQTLVKRGNNLSLETITSGQTQAQVLALISSGTNNLRSMVNVLNYGAVADAGVTDSTLSISNAALAAQVLRLPLYFPACPSNTYYKVSGVSAVFDGNNWYSGVNIPVFDTGAGIEIVADENARIVQNSDASIFVFTNGINWVKISGGAYLHNSAATSTKGAIALFCQGFNLGQNSDNVSIDHARINGFKYGIYSESTCSFNLLSTDLSVNQWAFWLVYTNAAGNNATGNNSVSFNTCSWGNCWNGGFIDSGIATFRDTESGGHTQTNFITTSSATLTLEGGNVELFNGAGVNVIGSSPGSVAVVDNNFGLLDFSGGNCYYIYSTNLSGDGPTARLSRRGLQSRDDAQSHHISVGYGGSTAVIGTNSNLGRWNTNNFGGFTDTIMVNDGVNYNGGVLSSIREGRFMMKYDFDAKGRSMPCIGLVSNWGPNQVVYSVPIAKYNYDLADGIIVQTTVSNNFTAAASFRAPNNNDNENIGLVLRGGKTSVGSRVVLSSSIWNDTEDGGSIGFSVNPSASSYGSDITISPNIDPINGVHTNALIANYLGDVSITNNLFVGSKIKANSVTTTATNLLTFTSVSSLTNTLGRDAFAIVSAGTSVSLQDTNGNSIATLGSIATLDLIVPLRVNMRLSGTGVSAILY